MIKLMLISIVFLFSLNLFSNESFDELTKNVKNHFFNDDFKSAKSELDNYGVNFAEYLKNDSARIEYLKLQILNEFYSKKYENADSLVNYSLMLYKNNFKEYSTSFLELISMQNAITLALGDEKKFDSEFAVYMNYVDTIYKLNDAVEPAYYLHYFEKIKENLICHDMFVKSQMINELDYLYNSIFKEYEKRAYENTWSYGFMLLEYSNFLLNIGLYDESRKIILKALDITLQEKYKKIDVSYTPYNNLAANESFRGNFQKSLDYANHAYNIIKDGGNLDEHANCLIKIALSNQHLGNFTLAEESYRKAELLLDSIYISHQQNPYYRDNEGYMGYHYHLKANNYYNWGNLLLDLNNISEANTKYSKAIELLKNYDNYDFVFRTKNSYLKLAFMNSLTKETTVADSLFDRVIGINRTLLRNIFLKLPEYMKEKYIPKLKNDFDIYYNFLVENIHNSIHLIKLLETRLNTKGFLFYSSKKFKDKIAENKSPEVAQLLATQNSIYSKLSHMLIGRELEQLNFENEIDSLKQLSRNIDKSLARILKMNLEDNFNQVESWTQIQNCLQKDEAAIEIIRIPKYKLIPNTHKPNISNYKFSDSIVYVAIIIRKDKPLPEYVILENSYNLENDFYKTYESTINPEKKSIVHLSSEELQRDVVTKLKMTYKNYFKAIDSKLLNIKKIFMSNDGIYNKINLEILIDESNEYLFEKFDIIILSSSKDLLSDNIKKDSTNSIVLFGGIDYEIQKENQQIKSNFQNLSNLRNSTALLPKFPYLPYTFKEVGKIHQIFMAQNWNSALFTNENATKANLLSINSPRILHIASHAFFQTSENSKSANNELQSLDLYTKNGLIFAGANTKSNDLSSKKRLRNYDNGILTSLEAVNLNLDDTQLVVLSACETGNGEIHNGEGVYGLQRAFQLAGASQIIMSLWKIDDEATQILLTDFYKEYVKSLDAKSSLKHSQAKLRKNPRYSHPKFWGAFILFGK